jgi:hypothetical protein
MDTPHIAMFVGIGFMILQTVTSKMSDPKKKYASLEDRDLFQTNSFNRRFFILSLILALSLPPLFGMIFGILNPMSSNVTDGLISFVVLAMLVVVSTAMHYWQLSGISKTEIEYRKYKNNSEPAH